MLIPLLLLPLTASTVTAPPPANVVIDTGWGGLGEPFEEHFELTVAADELQRLAETFSAAPMERDAALRTLASPSWLAAHAGSSYGVLTRAQGECSPEARELFTKTFTDRTAAMNALRAHYDSGHTDDFPSMSVELRLADGRKLRAGTGSQNAMMLPWKSDRGETWNPEISRAVAAILPDSSKLRSRLLDETLSGELASEIGDVIRDRWEELEETCLYAAIASKLKQRVTIERVYHAWPGQYAAHLRVPGSPPNLLIDVHLDADQKNVVETFFERIPAYIEVARKFVSAHPETVYELWYKNGESVTGDSLELHELGNPDDPNLKRVKANIGSAVQLRDHADPYAHRQWVVLPTGEAVKWDG